MYPTINVVNKYPLNIGNCQYSANGCISVLPKGNSWCLNNDSIGSQQSALISRKTIAEHIKRLFLETVSFHFSKTYILRKDSVIGGQTPCRKFNQFCHLRGDQEILPQCKSIRMLVFMLIIHKYQSLLKFISYLASVPWISNEFGHNFIDILKDNIGKNHISTHVELTSD